MLNRAREWDEYDAYLFDIDGTLLNCRDAVHYFAFCEALTSLAGRPLNLDGVSVHGNTDIGILRDALRLNAVSEERWRPHLAQAARDMCSFVQTSEGDLKAEATAGAAAVLGHLAARGALLGVATGNLEAIGWLKLERSGLRTLFHFGTFSDGYEYRRDIFRAAVQEAERRTASDARICVVGDTPSDIQAARDNGLDVIAVATGIFGEDELRAESPTWCIRSFEQLLARDSGGSNPGM